MPLKKLLLSRLMFPLLVLLFSQGIIYADEQMKNDFMKQKFNLLYRRVELPEAVWPILDQSKDIPIANPGEQYDGSDVPNPYSHLSSRRIIFAGVSEKVSFVYYSEGGFGGRSLLLFKLEKNKIAEQCTYILQTREGVISDIDYLQRKFKEIIEPHSENCKSGN